MPKTKETISVQSRVDIKTLALLAEYCYNSNQGRMTKSQLISTCLDYLVKLLGQNKLIKNDLTSVTDAMGILDELTFTQRSLQLGRERKKLFKIKAQDSLEIEQAEGYVPIRHMSNEKIEAVNQEAQAAADKFLVDRRGIEISNEKFEALQKTKDEKKLKDMKDIIGLRPEGEE